GVVVKRSRRGLAVDDVLQRADHRLGGHSCPVLEIRLPECEVPHGRFALLPLRRQARHLLPGSRIPDQGLYAPGAGEDERIVTTHRPTGAWGIRISEHQRSLTSGDPVRAAGTTVRRSASSPRKPTSSHDQHCGQSSRRCWQLLHLMLLRIRCIAVTFVTTIVYNHYWL